MTHNPNCVAALRRLEHLASTLNSRQHAGLKITPPMWAQLYDACNEAKAVIDAPDDRHLLDGVREG